jgi:two-component system, cell cycle sensor histidine kinase and response regulator CckA
MAASEDEVQAEKMRALGQFAAGIAHDFNNVLTRVMGQVALVDDALARGDLGQASTDLLEVETSARQGAELVRKLLGFSRRQRLSLRPLRTSMLLEEASSFLRVLLPSSVELRTRVVEDGWIRADAVLLEHIVMNLATNARDAMPEGGTLWLETARRVLDPEGVEAWGWGEPGEYMVIRVRDNGSGMPPEVLSKVLDPFFTTKADGGGTGLGLAMVYGLMKQHGGWVRLESAPGEGTSADLLFPVAPPPGPDETPPAPDEDPATGGSERILVAEDDEAIRAALARVLKRHGYTVRTAADGVEALALLRLWPEADLVITDVAMPRLGGPGLARALEAENIRIPVLYSSGEGSEPVRKAEGLPPKSLFLHKPWTTSELLARVRLALARHPRGPGADEPSG